MKCYDDQGNEVDQYGHPVPDPEHVQVNVTFKAGGLSVNLSGNADPQKLADTVKTIKNNFANPAK